MVFDCLGTFYAVVDRRSKQVMLAPLGLISLFSNLREAHRIAEQSGGVVVRCKRLELYDDPIGVNGKILKRP